MPDTTPTPTMDEFLTLQTTVNSLTVQIQSLTDQMAQLRLAAPDDLDGKFAAIDFRLRNGGH